MNTLLSTLFTILGLSILLGVILFLIHENYSNYTKRLENYKVDAVLNEKKRLLEKKRKTKGLRIFSYIFNGVFAVLFVSGLTLAITLRITHSTLSFNSNEAYVICETGSMSKAHKDNTYLEVNNLTNQIKTKSLVKLEKVSDDTSINIYDVCAYRDKNNDLVIHRIISSMEMEGKTFYIFKGDANTKSDQYLIRSDEIEYKYTGEHNDLLGYFISYLRSPVGITAILYVLISFVAYDISERKKIKFLASYMPNMEWWQKDILYKEDLKEIDKQTKKFNR